MPKFYPDERYDIHVGGIGLGQYDRRSSVLTISDPLFGTPINHLLDIPMGTDYIQPDGRVRSVRNTTDAGVLPLGEIQDKLHWTERARKVLQPAGILVPNFILSGRFNAKEYEGYGWYVYTLPKRFDLVALYLAQQEIYRVLEPEQFGPVELGFDDFVPMTEFGKVLMTLGRGVKLIHDQGFVHNQLHTSNCGACIDIANQDRIRAYIRDFSTVQDVRNYSQKTNLHGISPAIITRANDLLHVTSRNVEACLPYGVRTQMGARNADHIRAMLSASVMLGYIENVFQFDLASSPEQPRLYQALRSYFNKQFASSRTRFVPLLGSSRPNASFEIINAATLQTSILYLLSLIYGSGYDPHSTTKDSLRGLIERL